MLVALSFTDDDRVVSLAFDLNVESEDCPDSILETCLFLISSSVFFHSALASFQYSFLPSFFDGSFALTSLKYSFFFFLI